MKLKKGSPLASWKAFAEACPTCKNQRSDLCEKCKMEIESGYDPKPEFAITNADRIRAMSDEELAQNLLQFNTLEGSVPFCKNLAECDELLNTEDGIPEEKCKACLLEWLRQQAEVLDG